MSGIRTNAAAELLGVSPNTLRSWERRFGFPKPRRTPGGHRQYDLAELEALRRTLQDTHNISSAIAIARERGEGPSTTTRLIEAFERLDEDAADRVMEESLAVRSVDRSVEELLLPALDQLRDRPNRLPEYELAYDWAAAWLESARRVAPPPSRSDAVLLIDASERLQIEGLQVLGLVVALRRAGFPVRRFSTNLPLKRLAPAIRAIRPGSLVLCGGEVPLEAVAQLVYHLRSQTPFVGVVADYRGAVRVARRDAVHALGDRPTAAVAELKAQLELAARDGARGLRRSAGAALEGPAAAAPRAAASAA